MARSSDSTPSLSPIASALMGIGEQIIKAADDRWMKEDGWHLRTEGYWTKDQYVVTHPRSDGTGATVRLLGEPVPVLEAKLEVIFKRIRTRVRGAFRPWLGLPDPELFNSYYHRIEAACGKLTFDSSSGPSGVKGGNGALSRLEDVKDAVRPFNGRAMVAFRENYLNKVEHAISGQAAVGGLLGAALVGQKDLLKSAHKDVVAIARATRSAMPRENSASGLELRVVSAGLAIGALIVTGGSGAVMIAAASTAVGIFSDFKPEEETAGERVPSRIHGDNYDQIMSSVEDALHDLSEMIGHREQAIINTLERACRQIDADRSGQFNLHQVGRLIDTTKVERLGIDTSDDLTAHEQKEIDLDLGVVRKTANYGMKVLANQFREAQHEADAAVSSTIWKRSTRVGLDSGVGARDAWMRLHHRFVKLLDEMFTEIDGAREHLRRVANLLDHTETEVERSLKKHKDAYNK